MNNRSCPNCRDTISTKRDLRPDYNLSSLIHYSFGNRNKFCKDIECIEELNTLKLEKSNSKSSGIVRSKSVI